MQKDYDFNALFKKHFEADKVMFGIETNLIEGTKSFIVHYWVSGVLKVIKEEMFPDESMADAANRVWENEQ